MTLIDVIISSEHRIKTLRRSKCILRVTLVNSFISLKLIATCSTCTINTSVPLPCFLVCLRTILYIKLGGTGEYEAGL